VVPGQQFRLSLDNQAPAAALHLGSSASSIPAWTILDRDGDDHLDVFWSTGLAVDECVAWNWSLGWKRDLDHGAHVAMVGQSDPDLGATDRDSSPAEADLG